MARKSRKETLLETEPMETMRTFHAALYVRLSNEERFNRANKNSFKNQKEFLLEYVEKHPEISVYKIYEDNGVTGTTFDRAGFSEMMYDVSNEKVNCIIVKDLSRFGREHIEAGKYLDYLFPMIGLRFIAINDNYDTFDKVKDNDMIVPFKNIINAVYAKDISRKVIATKEIQQTQGVFIGATAPYGFVLSEDRRFLIDPDAARIVKRIFEEYAAGASALSICRNLSHDGIDTPSVYFYKKGIFKNPNQMGENLWKAQPLLTMLRNPAYAGHMTQGKYKSKFLKTGEKKMQAVSSSEWKVVKNTHTAIVSQELFDKVQNLMIKNSKRKKNAAEHALLTSKIFCGECGHRMKKTKRGKEKTTIYYTCSQHELYPELCGFQRIQCDVIDDMVLKSIKQYISAALDAAEVTKEVAASYKTRQKKQQFEAELYKRKMELRDLQKQRFDLFNDCINNVVESDEFLYARQTYAETYERLKQTIATLEHQYASYTKMLEPSGIVDKLKNYRSARKLSREMVDYFIKRVTVYSDKKIEIQWSFQNVFEEGGNKIEG